MLQCNDESIYVGVTNDVARRFNEHQTAYNPNAYTASRLPVKIIYIKSFRNFIEAIQYENKLKKWSRDKKLALTMNNIELLKKLAECTNETSHKNYIRSSEDLTP